MINFFYLCVLLISAFSAYNVSAQDPQIEWQNTIGGSAWDELTSIEVTTDGGYICGGTSASDISGDKTEDSNGSTDYWIVKIDSVGNIQWQNTIGGNSTDGLFDIKQTLEGGYICGGTSISGISGDKTEDIPGSSYDWWILKLDSAGQIEWQNTIGGTLNDRFNSIQQTNDGGYICGGSSESNISVDKADNSRGDFDYWIVKLDSIGNIQWQNTIGGDTTEILHSIQQTMDGGYICGGWSLSNISGDKTENSNGLEDYWVVKLDNSGQIEWQNTIGGNSTDYAFDIKQTSNKGFICGGSSLSNISGDKTENRVGMRDYWILKLDSLGVIQWQNTIGGNHNDDVQSIYQTLDGGYICGGNSSSDISGDKTENNKGGVDYWIIKLDSTGNFLWENTIGGDFNDNLNTVKQTSDGTLIIGGWSKSDSTFDKSENSQGNYDFWIVKLKDGICFQNPIALTSSKSSVSCFGANNGSIQLNLSGGNAPFYITWNTTPSQTGTQIQNLGKGFYTATITDALGCTTSTTIEVKELLQVQIFTIPVSSNPSGTATGSINLLVSGGAGPYNYLWTTGATTEDISNLIPGVYTVQVTDAHGCAQQLSVIVQ